MRCFWIVLAVVIANMGVISAAKLVVIRDDSSSKSEEEESEEASNSDESKEIDLLLELIQKEKLDRKPQQQQVRTIKLIRHKPTTEVATQESMRKEKVQKPKMAKEYHVHYHNHQHPKPENSALNFEEDKVRPILWDSLASHLDTFQDFYSLPKMERTPLLSVSDLSQFKKYSDFESLLESKDPFLTNDKSRDQSLELHSDMDAILSPVQTVKKSKSSKGNIEVLKKYQALLNSRFTSHPPRYHHHKPSHHQSSSLGNDNFPNHDRFAGFTDFSTLENTQHKTKVVPNAEPPKNDRQEDLGIKDFAIVIKTKSREASHPSSPKKNTRVPNRPRYSRRPNPGLYKSRHQLESRNVPKRPFKLPRLLDAPGGSPKYVDKMNGIKYTSDNRLVNVASRHNVNQNLNSIESQHRQMVQLRPFSRANNSVNNHVYNAWVMQRLLR